MAFGISESHPYFHKIQGASKQMINPKIRILKRPDRIASETAAKSRLAVAALLIAKKVGLRDLSRSVNDWISERDENRAKENDESRKQILAWKEE